MPVQNRRPRRGARRSTLAFTAAGILLCAAPAFAQTPRNVMRLSLEELLDVEVTSVSKKEERLMGSAAAITVITQDDLRRSGATSLMEVLRLVPGLQVARIDSNKYAISARGFNGRFANKLLVLLDGRSLYTPLFSGVFWEVQDTMLEDIERIEVIRGPGAALWGANAVNGVINIVTKSATATRGVVASAGAGGDERGFGAVRYGGGVGDIGAYRVYGKYFSRAGSIGTARRAAGDDWNVARGGFRIDLDLSQRDGLMVSGDIYEGDIGQVTAPPSVTPSLAAATASRVRVSGANVLGRWQRTLAEGQISAQFYVDRTARSESLLREDRQTADLAFDHRMRLGRRHEFQWGGSARVTSDDIGNTALVSLWPASRRDHIAGLFVQDEIALVPDRFRLVVGTKVEKNSYTGWEVQPNLRASWTPGERSALWGAVSRAVRMPSRAESDMRLSGVLNDPTSPLPVAFLLTGSPDVQAESVIVTEVGYRVRAFDRVFVDVTGYVNHYQDLISYSPSGLPALVIDPPAMYLVAPLSVTNGARGHATGLETAVTWEPAAFWRASTSWGWIDMRLRDQETGEIADDIGRVTPRYQGMVRSMWTLPRRVEVDAIYYRVGGMPGHAIAGYNRVDVRAAWRPIPALELSLTAQNLFDQRYLEFYSTLGEVPGARQRSVYGKATWRF
ncbi:MAG: TonB-dependent receptor [Acidobacteriota bacterium]